MYIHVLPIQLLLCSEGVHSGQVYGHSALPLREQGMEQHCENTSHVKIHAMYIVHACSILCTARVDGPCSTQGRDQTSQVHEMQ